MENNPITNTLFRFVGLRSPQLVDETTRATKFVTQPNPLFVGYFSGVISTKPVGVSKKTALADAAVSFTPVYGKEDTIKAAFPETYAFSQWIVKNRGSYIQDDLLAQLAKVTRTLSTQEYEDVWDSLYYQIITQKSFYTKEALMQLLLGDHVFKLIDKSPTELFSKYNDNLLHANIALPVELFGDYIDGDKVAPEEETPGTLHPVTPNKETKKNLVVTEASYRIEKYGILKKELQKSEKAYRKNYSTAYDGALDSYNTTVKPILETYREAVEAKKTAYCAAKDPQTVYDPNDPCQQPEDVPAPDLPKFTFSYDPEVSAERMTEDLSEDAYADLLEVLHRSKNPRVKMIQPEELINPSEIFESYKTYQDVYKEIDIANDTEQDKILQNTNIVPKKVTVAGVTLPVARASRMEDFAFELYGTKVNKNTLFSLSMGVPDKSWKVDEIKVITKSPTDNTIIDTKSIINPNVVTNTNTQQLDWVYAHRTPTETAVGFPTVDIEFNFTNGVTKTVPSVSGALQTGVKGKVIGDDSMVFHGGNTITPAFKPTNFGFTNIGVADYKRVDQTIHCYVEGEVSHIENIMAREYKERATRMLRRSEETTTTSTETEQEKLTDTTTTDRFEMQSEVDKAIQESKDKSGFVSTGYSYGNEATGTFTLNAGLSFANNTSKQDSIRQSRTEAQEITERALDRVVKKVKEERVRKVIEEFEENNKHGFDNRQGSQHVVGVYRWVDKLYKNQIVNYGTRMMLEFMVPDPSRLHVLGLKKAIDLDSAKNEILIPPPDPRIQQDENSGNLILNHAWSIQDDDQTNVSYWSGYYNVDIEPQPESLITVGESFNIKYNEGTGFNLDDCKGNSGNGKVSVPEGYRVYAVKGILNTASFYPHDPAPGRFSRSITVGNVTNRDSGAAALGHPLQLPETTLDEINPYYTEVPVSFTLGNYAGGDVSVTLYCTRTQEANHAWKLKTFNAIIDAYEEALADYNEKVKNQKSQIAEERRTNPGFFRQIENMILRKNCISYLLDQNPEAVSTYGKSMDNGGTTFEDYEITPTQELTNYASFVKFMEQAFEWDIMSYNFYPYYWGDRESWNDLYSFDNSDDPVFRSFMQSGMARVIVSVRPGFEDAVKLYLSTRMIWNGGTVPIIGDEMFLSLTDELEERDPYKEGDPWITRVPSSLTILQADSIGLKVEKALPCNCDDPDFDNLVTNGYQMPCSSNFELNDSQLGSEQKKQIQFTFQRMNNLFNKLDESNPVIQYFDDNGYFPKIYECMGQEIIIERDASWETWDNLSIIYGQLAERLSLIAGVTAEVIPYYEENDKLYPDAIRFTIDTDIIPEFMFIKKDNHGAWDPNFDMLRVVANNSTVRVIHDNHYLSERILDKEGTFIQDSEQNTLLPISRFKYE